MNRLFRTLVIGLLATALLFSASASAAAATYTCGGSTCNLVMDNSTLANFQSWSSPIYNALTTFGWVQTSDTGQAANPIAAVPSSTYVYWIFKANDSLASTMPEYLKVEIGYSSTTPNIRMTLGTGSNGSGTITGQVVSGAPWQITDSYGNTGSTTYPSFFSGDAGNFRMYLWQSTSAPSAVIFEASRSVNSSGVQTSDYVTAISGNQFYCQGSCLSPGIQQSMSSTYLYPQLSNYEAAGCATTPGTGAANGSVADFPFFPFIGKLGNPMLDMMAVCNGDIADGATVTVASMYGSSHTYVAVRSFQTNVSEGFNPFFMRGNYMGFLMRYE